VASRHALALRLQPADFGGPLRLIHGWLHSLLVDGACAAGAHLTFLYVSLRLLALLDRRRWPHHLLQLLLLAGLGKTVLLGRVDQALDRLDVLVHRVRWLRRLSWLD